MVSGAIRRFFPAVLHTQACSVHKGSLYFFKLLKVRDFSPAYHIRHLFWCGALPGYLSVDLLSPTCSEQAGECRPFSQHLQQNFRWIDFFKAAQWAVLDWCKSRLYFALNFNVSIWLIYTWKQLLNINFFHFNFSVWFAILKGNSNRGGNDIRKESTWLSATCLPGQKIKIRLGEMKSHRRIDFHTIWCHFFLPRSKCIKLQHRPYCGVLRRREHTYLSIIYPDITYNRVLRRIPLFYDKSSAKFVESGKVSQEIIFRLQ